METTLYSLLKTQANRYPDKPALRSLNRHPLTYAGLLELVEYSAQALHTLGLRGSDRVAIVLPNGPEMAAAFLAVASCSASAPLNPAYSQVEFDFYLASTNASALVLPAGSDSPARQVAMQRGLSIIEMDSGIDQPAGWFTFRGVEEKTRLPAFKNQKESIALILHTSGTTSTPKIVPLSQANLYVSARNIQRTLHLTEKDSCLNVMPLFHIHGLVAAVLATLSSGGSLICMPGFSPEAFFEHLDKESPTWYSAVPTIHQSILEASREHQAVLARSSLRFIRSSSAALPPNVMASLETTFQCPVIEAYGMTEAAHQMASNPLPPLPRKPGSVGLPAGPQVAIMDEAGTLLAVGQPGEIVIQGENVTSGYENNQSANAVSYTNGWFRTGDQGYLDQDGYLFLTGRLKEIINRGGEKIAPRDVDEVFLEHPVVAQAVTFSVPHPTLGEDVAVALVLKPGGSTNVRELREYAFEKLARHKVPSQFVIVDQIPKGPTGKLQRIGLFEKFASLLKSPYLAPQDEVSLSLAKMWTLLLKVEQVGMLDNFFALGGDSLLAAQLLARIRSSFDIDLPLSLFFEEPTLAGQSAIVEDILLSAIEGMSDDEASQMNGSKDL